MATRHAIATMESEAQRRIDEASATLAERFGVEVPAVPFERRPELRILRQMETSATFLEAIAGAQAGATKGTKAMTEKTPPELDEAADAESEGVEIGAEVTKDGTPVVVTETADGETAKPAKGKKS